MTAGFLLLAGLTGSLLAFEHDLEVLLNPHLFVATPSADIPSPAPLDPFELREHVQDLEPKADVSEVVLGPHPGQSAMFWLTPRINPDTGQPFKLSADQLFVDPATGEELGRRQWGEFISNGEIHWENLIPFLWRLHSSLALPEPWGAWLFGAIALIWTLDCFIGLFLTLPRFQRAQRPFLKRWKPAWLIKWHSGAYRINLDLHRCIGLWLWFMLLVFAWSSVMLNLRQEVYNPVMSLAFEFSENNNFARPKTESASTLDWRAAHAAAAYELNRLSVERGFTINHENSLLLNRKRNIYIYRVHTSEDVYDAAPGAGKTKIVIDASSGAFLGASFPSGDAAGNTVSNWLQGLHMANVFGLPYRLFVCVIGVMVAVLSVTGVIVWLKKRRAQAHRIERKVAAYRVKVR